jgi:hypothetical protein
VIFDHPYNAESASVIVHGTAMHRAQIRRFWSCMALAPGAFAGYKAPVLNGAHGGRERAGDRG